MDNQRQKYASVNGAWPDGTDEGRAIKPSPQEALSGAKRLYRTAMGRPFRGKMKLTSGRRYTYIRRGVFYVNPDQRYWNGRGGGWHEIVHGISHYACARLHPRAKGHGHQHAFIERQLVAEVVKRGWLGGKLKRPDKAKPVIDKKRVALERIVVNAKRWEARRKRADTALKKLARRRRYYERTLAA